jgi:hypothetical protein
VSGRKIRALAALALAFASTGRHAHAEPEPTDRPKPAPLEPAKTTKPDAPEPSRRPDPNAPEPSKRKKPNYDGRGEPPTTAGDVALWVPRILLSPVYLTTEYIIRRPLGWLISTAERNSWAPAIIDFFTFGEDHKAGVVPTAFLEFNFRVSVGLYFFWDDFLVEKNDLRLRGQFGGPNWVSFGAVDRIHLGKDSFLGLGADFTQRPDYVFHGIGPSSLEANRSRYQMLSVDTGPLYDLTVTDSVHFRTKVGFKTASFSDGSFGDDPSISQEVARGSYPLPPGFVGGYTSVYEHADLSFDSRKPRPAPGNGVRISARIDHGTDLRANPGASWIRYGGTAGAYWDVTGQARTLGLVASTDFVESLRGDAIPFTEQVMLGGSGAMAGFRYGRLVGQSAVTAALVYRWPIWVWLDGALLVATGNVFDAHLRGFDPKLLRLSSGIGIRSTGSPDHQIELDLGIGTETFDQGADVTSFRIAIGGTNGF